MYQYLQLDDLISGRSSVYDDAALPGTLVSDVTLEARTLDDGTPVEAITLFFDRDGLVQSLRATPNDGAGTALADMMYDAVDSNSYAKTVLVVGPDNTPVQFEAATVVETAAIDARALDSGHYPEGTQLAFVLDSSTSRTFSRIDEPLEPVSVPE